MYEIGVVDGFEAAHHLEGDFGPATRPHGHTYRVEVTVRGTSLRSDGTLFDLGRLRQAVRGRLAALHYRDLNELTPFAKRNSTAEQVAAYLLECLREDLHDPQIETFAVRVWESPEGFAGVEEPASR
jgi:6-pyruvoyltetrahydropterin/6-carboxytetrahydropterin synthase